MRINSAQPRYNLLFRSFERDLLPLCAKMGEPAVRDQHLDRPALDNKSYARCG